MSVTAALVKELREKSGAGMMDCKKALAETDGDMEAAVDWLRTKGLATAAKKSGRVASEGLVAFCVDGTKGALIELNAETDFVARNTEFQVFASTLAKLALDAEDIKSLSGSDYPETGRNVADELTNKIATIGENMSLRRMAMLSVGSGMVVPYMHNSTALGLGRIGVLVALESTAGADVLEGLGKQIAMHIAATSPASLLVEDLDPESVQRERDVEIALTGFVRFNLGEGIEKEETDFAAEVAAQLS